MELIFKRFQFKMHLNINNKKKYLGQRSKTKKNILQRQKLQKTYFTQSDPVQDW